MKIAVLQYASVCGDIRRNVQAIVTACKKAKNKGVDLLLTPHLALTGFPLKDLLKHDSFYKELEDALACLFKIKGLAIFLSYPCRVNGQIRICNSLFYNNKVVYDFSYLQKEIFKAGPQLLKFKDISIALFWYESITYCASLKSVDFIIYQSDQPFYSGLIEQLQEKVCTIVSQTSKSVLCLRPLGANDELVYEGGSFAVNHQCEMIFQAEYFKDRLEVFDYDLNRHIFCLSETAEKRTAIVSRVELIYHAIVFSLQNYLRKIGFQRICLGLSGGIDSALVLAIAVEAVGAQNCEVLLMPSQYSSEISVELASQMASQLGVVYSIVPIDQLFNHYLQVLAPVWGDRVQAGIAEENIQARIRGVLLMALSNHREALLLATGNKSEAAVGYCTLYGDTNGGFAPISDLYKTEVYEMAKWLNKTRNSTIIPQGIIDRAPSAELRPNQTDQDSLPDYAKLDQIISLVLDNRDLSFIVAQGYEESTAKQVMHLIRANEFKRQQEIFGPKLSRRSFSAEWNYPITNLCYFY